MVCTTPTRRSAARTTSREHGPCSLGTLACPEGAGACEHLDEEALRRRQLDLGQQKRRRDEGEKSPDSTRQCHTPSHHTVVKSRSPLVHGPPFGGGANSNITTRKRFPPM